MSLFKSKQRVADHGEVFTPAWMVEAMLDMDQFAALFAPDRDYLVQATSRAEARRANPWLAEAYVQEKGQEAYMLDGDPNEVEAANNVSDRERACDYFQLVSPDRAAAIEVFVHDGGRTDVWFVRYFPAYKLEEMMPSA